MLGPRLTAQSSGVVSPGAPRSSTASLQTVSLQTVPLPTVLVARRVRRLAWARGAGVCAAWGVAGERAHHVRKRTRSGVGER